MKDNIRIIRCNRPGCIGKIAYMNGKGFIDIKRGSQQHQIIADNVSFITTCPYSKCKTLTSIILKNGEVSNEDSLRIEDFTPSEDKKEDVESKEVEKTDINSNDNKDGE